MARNGGTASVSRTAVANALEHRDDEDNEDGDVGERASPRDDPSGCGSSQPKPTKSCTPLMTRARGQQASKLSDKAQ
jgi:hypothetical protein